VQVTKFFQWFVIRVQNKMLAREVFIEKVHAPHSGCGLQPKNTLFEIICHRPQEKI